MSSIEIIVAINNPTLRYLMMRTLKQLKLKFVTRPPMDPLCEIASVTITDIKDSNLQAARPVLVRNKDDIEAAVIEVLAVINRVEHASHAVIGVDPGLRFGLAIVLDGVSVYTASLNSPIAAARQTIRWVHIIRERLSHVSLVIRVGTGSRLFSVLYLRNLHYYSDDFIIELVNEHHTTVMSGSATDEHAAVLIAQKQGQLFDNAFLTVDHKEGNIRLLKRLYMTLTNTSLSTSEAIKIISGEMRLDEMMEK